MATKKDKTEVVNTETGEVTEYDPSMFEADEGVGSDGMGAEDLALPFLKALSRQDEVLDTLPDAKNGDILNTATLETWDGEEGILVVPCVYQRRFIHWAPRGEGTGAPIAIYSPDDAMPPTERDPQTNRDMVVDSEGHPLDGTYIEETHQHFVVQLLPSGGRATALVALKSTQLKKSRKWNSMVGSRSMMGKNGAFTPPRFSHTYRLTTVPEKNDKGSWNGWNITLEGPITDPKLYAMAKEFAASVAKGDVEVKHDREEGGDKSGKSNIDPNEGSVFGD